MDIFIYNLSYSQLIGNAKAAGKDWGFTATWVSAPADCSLGANRPAAGSTNTCLPGLQDGNMDMALEGSLTDQEGM